MASFLEQEVSPVRIFAPTPLPPGWTEHRAPTGQFYYYHAASGESTYVRPSIHVEAGKSQDGEQADKSSAAKTNGSKPRKKEKPKTKEPIPDTLWLKVTTNEGNVFFTNTQTKTSSWTVPEEIREQVKQFESRKKEEGNLRRVEELRQKELDQKRLIDLEVAKVRAEVEAEVGLRALKRKEPPDQAAQPPQGFGQPSENPPKVLKSLDTAEGSMADHDDEDADVAWQRQVAEEMALEAMQEAPPPQVQQAPPPQMLRNLTPSIPPGLSTDELKATFKAMLLEKSIDPMAPWDNELPKFVTDSRYLAIPSMKERRDIFDEFCKEKIRQQRAAKQAVPRADPAQAYRSLLVEFVTSTRTLWEEFKAQHKKEPRFRNFGRDDREREKAFKGWLKELGELKRKEFNRSEKIFKSFISENIDQIKDMKQWKDVRDVLKKIDEHKFNTVISSNSTKESIWKNWAQVLESESARLEKSDHHGSKEAESLKAREEEVQKLRSKIEKETNQTRNLIEREEAEREFRLLLIDAVRDHDLTWHEVKPSLEKDPRFQKSAKALASLDQSQLLNRIFKEHLHSIYLRRLKILEDFFDQQVHLHHDQNPLTFPYSKMRDTVFDLLDIEGSRDEPLSSERLLQSSTIKKLLLGSQQSHRSRSSRMDEALEKFFADWKARHEDQAQQDFQTMLGESSFIDFWCRLKKSELERIKTIKQSTASTSMENEEGENIEKKVEIQLEEEDDDEENERVDLREMAKGINSDEIENVLKKDKRWTVWSHRPEQRETWIRDYLDNLAAPRKTVYQKN